MGHKVSRAERRAFAAALHVGAATLESIAHGITRIDHNHFPDSLTPTETKYMERLKTRLHDDAQLMRKFARRLRT